MLQLKYYFGVNYEVNFFKTCRNNFQQQKLFQGQFDCELSDMGIKKTKELKKNFNKKYDYCYCSTLTRARQTAKILNNNLPIKYDKRLIENSFGEWEKNQLPRRN